MFTHRGSPCFACFSYIQIPPPYLASFKLCKASKHGTNPVCILSDLFHGGVVTSPTSVPYVSGYMWAAWSKMEESQNKRIPAATRDSLKGPSPSQASLWRAAVFWAGSVTTDTRPKSGRLPPNGLIKLRARCWGKEDNFVQNASLMKKVDQEDSWLKFVLPESWFRRFIRYMWVGHRLVGDFSAGVWMMHIWS
jgi:hypothetical protein